MDIISPNFKEMGEPNVVMKRFPDRDSYVRVENPLSGEGRQVRLFHRLYPEQDHEIFNAFLLLDTLSRSKAEVRLISPYLPYSRQDKTFKQGEAKSAEVLCTLLKKAGAKELVTIDCHFLKKEGEFEYAGLKIRNLSANKLLIEHAKEKLQTDELEVISPDQGANYLVSDYGGKSMKKVRGDYEEGSDVCRSIDSMKMDFDVKGKDVLIIDDMISTGGTMMKAVENARSAGAERVLCAATHGFFLKKKIHYPPRIVRGEKAEVGFILKDSYEEIKKKTDAVFVTNSIPHEAAEVDITGLLQ